MIYILIKIVFGSSWPTSFQQITSFVHEIFSLSEVHTCFSHFYISLSGFNISVSKSFSSLWIYLSSAAAYTTSHLPSCSRGLF